MYADRSLRPRRLLRHLPELERFCAGLPARDGRFFMFFTTGLLHWVRQAAGFVPPSVDLVLIGSGLTDDEVRWLRDHSGRPFHHVESAIDDKTAWELLFHTQRRHFGWIDVDCFVLDSGLFDAMRRLGPRDLANCTWSFRGPGGHRILKTFFLYVNADAIREVTRRIDVSPSVYGFETSIRGRMEPGATTVPVSPELESILRAALGTGPGGHPPYLSQTDFYDTLQVYQIAAESLGYTLRPVRELTGLESSDEVVHLGRVSYYNWAWGGKALPGNRNAYRVIAQADFLVLNHAADHLPPRYRSRLRHLRDELPRFGLPTDVTRLETIMSRALRAEGIGEDAARRILAAS